MTDKKPTEEQIKELAKEHWDWLEPILHFIGRPLSIEEVEYLFRTAIEHGYKHGQSGR